ncbi:PAZ domain protein [Ditylenchus destructor]|uniref:PAZ domain protein n=1 Tax=Ditylenchus destructor TaxID=166010 RepID=A0AAD4MK75_9BILA|nr:PAZ domain protein [Ditylenchus destructor]
MHPNTDSGEILLTTYLIRGHWYVFDDSFYMKKPKVAPQSNDVHVIRGGFRRKIVMFGPDRAHARPALILEQHDEAFYMDCITVDAYFKETQRPMSFEWLKEVTLINHSGHTFRFGGLSTKSAKETMIKRGNETISVERNFYTMSERRCNGVLPPVVENTLNGKDYHPQDFSKICSGQRINALNVPPRTKTTLANCRKSGNMLGEMTSMLDMLTQNFKAFGIDTFPNLATRAKVLSPPDIETGSGTLSICKSDPKFAYEDNKTQDFSEFFAQLISRAQDRGMYVQCPILVASNGTSLEELIQLTDRVKQQHHFLMVITQTDQKTTHMIHDGIKLVSVALCG